MHLPLWACVLHMLDCMPWPLRTPAARVHVPSWAWQLLGVLQTSPECAGPPTRLCSWLYCWVGGVCGMVGSWVPALRVTPNPSYMCGFPPSLLGVLSLQYPRFTCVTCAASLPPLLVFCCRSERLSYA